MTPSSRLRTRANPRSRVIRSSIIFLAVAAAIGVGSTLASNISLNSGAPVEFGQGVTTTTACDSNILMTPTEAFDNSSNGFNLNTITISDIARSCFLGGDIFLINLYGDSGSPLNTTPISIGLSATATDQNFYDSNGWNGNADVQVINGNLVSASVDISNSSTLDSRVGKSSVTISGFTSDGTNPIVASAVKRMTLESKVGSFGLPASFGGDGGGPFIATCPAGEVVTQIELASAPNPDNGYLPSLKFGCASPQSLTGGSTESYAIVDYGTGLDPSGTDITSACPAGKAGSGLDIVPGGYIVDAGLRCADFPAGNNALSLGLIDGHSGANSSDCPAGQWLTGLYGRKGAGIDRLGSICSTVNP